MKRITSILAAAAFFAFVSESALAQASATQSVTLSVNAVYKIAVDGNPGPLTITTGAAGTDALTSVSDNSTHYSITHNSGTAKITAEIAGGLSSGYSLEVGLASTKGTSLGSVDISSGTAVDVVTGIQNGADANQVITYTFSADASAGSLTSTAKTVTLTLTN